MPLNLNVPILEKRLSLSNAELKKLKTLISAWIISEKSAPNEEQLYPQLFKDIALIHSDGDEKLCLELYSKSDLNIEKIREIVENCSQKTFAIIVSPLLLYNEVKIERNEFRRRGKFDEVFLGLTIYDAKLDDVLLFEMVPLEEFPFGQDDLSGNVFTFGRMEWGQICNKIVLSLFEMSFHGISDSLVSTIFLPQSVDYGAPFPWIYYCVLSRKYDRIARESGLDDAFKMTVKDLFIFGVTPDILNTTPSFYYDKSAQTALVNYFLKVDDKTMLYQLRFDYHEAANLHVDLEVFDGNRSLGKLVKHELIDLGEMKEFNPGLLMIMAYYAMADPFFGRIIDKHVSGLSEMAKNPWLKKMFVDRESSLRMKYKDPYDHVSQNPELRNLLKRMYNEPVDEESVSLTLLQDLRSKGLVWTEGLKKWYISFLGKYVLESLEADELSKRSQMR